MIQICWACLFTAFLLTYNQAILKYKVHWQSRHAVLIFRAMLYLFFSGAQKPAQYLLEALPCRFCKKIFKLVKSREIIYFNTQILSVTFTLTNANPSHSTMKNTVISPNFLVWKFCGKAHNRPRLCGNCAFPQISTPGN